MNSLILLFSLALIQAAYPSPAVLSKDNPDSAKAQPAAPVQAGEAKEAENKRVLPGLSNLVPQNGLFGGLQGQGGLPGLPQLPGQGALPQLPGQLPNLPGQGALPQSPGQLPNLQQQHLLQGTRCQSHDDCSGNSICTSNICTPALPLGSKCTTDNECQGTVALAVGCKGGICLTINCKFGGGISDLVFRSSFVFSVEHTRTAKPAPKHFQSELIQPRRLWRSNPALSRRLWRSEPVLPRRLWQRRLLLEWWHSSDESRLAVSDPLQRLCQRPVLRPKPISKLSAAISTVSIRFGLRSTDEHLLQPINSLVRRPSP